MFPDDWLTAHEQQAWQPFLHGVRALQESLDRQLQASNQITHSYFEILVPLSEAPERSLRMSELADRTRSSRSRLSHAVGRLEQRGLIKRTGFPADRRGQVARLTDQGLDLVNKAAPNHADAVRSRLLDRLSPVQLATLSELGRIMQDANSDFLDGDQPATHLPAPDDSLPTTTPRARRAESPRRSRARQSGDDPASTRRRERGKSVTAVG